MEEDDVHDDRREESERERDEASAEQERAGDHLDPLHDGEEVTGSDQRADEVRGRPRHRRLRDEVEEAVQPEHEEDQAEEGADDERELRFERFHGVFFRRGGSLEETNPLRVSH